MVYAKLSQNIINILAIHFDQTGREEMEVVEIASHLKVPVDQVEKTIIALCEAGMVRMTMGNRYATLLKKGYAETQRF